MNREQDEQLERAARNQSLFREINEQVEALADAFRLDAGTAPFTCECADIGCVESIEMTVDEYEAVRADGNGFAVLPGHVYADVEDVVRTIGERYLVVAKRGRGAAIATAADPRSRDCGRKRVDRLGA